jgi:GntR family transcriptional regulator/MocR family aminotransferase
MPKEATTFELTLAPVRDGIPQFRWLYEAIRNEILERRLAPGTRLPATRDLAQQYRLSRGTVVRAFEELKSEGYLQGSAGSGTYVSQVLPESLLEVPKPGRREAGAKLPNEPLLSTFGRQVLEFPSYRRRAPRAFRSNVPALDLFPMTLWARLAARRLRRLSVHELAGSEALGYLPLRQAVARYLATQRGVKSSPEQVLITSGAQEALDLAARLLLDPGGRVAIEDPGYVGAARVFQGAGAEIVPVPLDAEGLDVRQLRGTGARLVYVTPGHQFPLGITMSLARRLALLEWAWQAKALIFEDDYDSEYRYSGRPLPALQGIDRHDRVIFAGTFSKVLFPALRLGYLVLPEQLVEPFRRLKSVTTRHAPVIDQAVLTDFIEGGHFARHLRRMRQVYGERLSILLEEGRRELAGAVEISPIEAGLQTVGWLAPGLDENAAEKAAEARGVEVDGLGRYSFGARRRAGLHLGFAAVDERELRRGARELAVALATRAPG